MTFKTACASLILLGLAACGTDQPTQGPDASDGADASADSDVRVEDDTPADTLNDGDDRDAPDSEDISDTDPDRPPLDAGDAAATDATDVFDAAPDLPLEWDYPLDDVLRLNHVQVKGTHNSYHLEPDLPLDPSHEYSHLPLDRQLGEQGVRQFELDVHFSPEGYFVVQHIPVIDAETTCATLVGCLEIVRSWSNANRHHSPIFIWVEPKDLSMESIRGHYDDLDAEIRAVFPSRLITPDMVQGEHATLRDAVLAGDWPTLGDVRGHVVFIMLDGDVHHQNYTYNRTTLEGRAMFVDAEDLSVPYAAFVKYNDPIGSGESIRSAAEQGFIVACNAGGIDNDDEQVQAKVEAALEVGAHTIGTDLPGPIGDRYWFDMPSDGVVRCNPVSAPDECVDTAIE